MLGMRQGAEMKARCTECHWESSPGAGRLYIQSERHYFATGHNVTMGVLDEEAFKREALSMDRDEDEDESPLIRLERGETITPREFTDFLRAL
jgi:hypothetical protein